MGAADDEKAGGPRAKPRAGAQAATSSPPASSAAAAALLERGLQMYGDGDLLGAITEWEAALTIDPGLARAREYVEYVRANFDALMQQFDAARDAEREAEAQGVPVLDVPDDPDAYDSLDVEVTVGAGQSDDDLADGLMALDAGLDEALSGPAMTVGTDEDGEASVEMEAMAPDEDLPGIAPELDEPELAPSQRLDDDEATIDVRMHRLLQRSPDPRHLDDPTPATNIRPAIMTIHPRPSFQMPPYDDVRGPDGESIDEDTGETFKDARAVDEDVEATRAYQPRQSGGIVVQPHRPAMLELDETAESDELPAELDEDHETRERGPFRAGGPPRPGRAPAGRDASSVIVDERLLRSAGLSGNNPAVPRAPGSGNVPAVPRAPGSGNAPPVARGAGPITEPPRTVEVKPLRDLSRDARAATITRRVTELLGEAEAAADKGNFLAAVAAVEEAGRCDEEGSVAPVLLHRHRDLLYRIYEGHLGDLSAVPLVAVPMHEIAAQKLDHRTGFLLSRIDGMLTFEDILDVAGMPRMEAYQILSSLLRKGVIEVR